MATSKSNPEPKDTGTDPNDPLSHSSEDRANADTSFGDPDQWTKRDEAAGSNTAPAPAPEKPSS